MKRQWLWNLLVGGLVFGVVVGYVRLETARQEAASRCREQARTATAADFDPAVRGEGMASWVVAGAGSADFNGTYEETGATHNGRPVYAKSGPVRYLGWWTLGMGPEGWMLGDALDMDPTDYYGNPGADLPCAPWSVDAGTPPAPTVSEVEEHDGPIHIRDCPRDVSEARIEWVDNAGDKLLMLGVEAATTTLKLDIYDPATGNWTEGADPPAALRDAAEFDTTVLDNKLYAAAWQPPIGNDVGVWEYDPAGDAWALKTQGDVTAEMGPPLRVAACPNWASKPIYLLTSTTAPGGGRYIGLHEVYYEAVWKWASAGRLTITSGSQLHTLLDAGQAHGGDYHLYALASDRTAMKVTPVRRSLSYSSIVGVSGGSLGEASSREHNWAHGAGMYATEQYYLFREDQAAGWRFKTTDDAIGETSYDVSRILDIAISDSSIYALTRDYPDDGTPAALYRLSPHPDTPTVTATVAGANVTVSWVFADSDLPTDSQSAYQIVIADDDGVLVHDTTKTASSASTFAHGPLADGGYSATVTLWDSDDLVSAEGSATFIIGGPGPLDNPPTVTVTDPNDGDTLFADTDITVAATDDTGVVSVQVLVDGTSIGVLTSPNDGADYTITWEVAGWANGQHTITAIATDTVGQTGTDTITIALNAGGDVEDPVVTILAPADAAVVGLDVPIIASATDNVAVVRVRFYVDDQLQETLTAPNYLGNYRHIWDSNGWANGSHTITVRAWDATGNFGSDSVTVTLDVTLANTTKYFFTKQLPFAGVADDWRLPALSPQLAIETFVTGEVPAELHRRYQVTVGVHVPGDSVNFDEYQVVRPDISHGFTVSGNTLRWALRAQPTLLESYWEIAADEALCLVPMPTGYPSVVVDGAAGLWHFDGADLVLWEALDLVTPRDATFWNGKVAIVGDNKFILKDADTDELTYPIALPAATDYRAVAGSSSYLYVAIDTALSHYLYRFTYDALTQAVELAASANVLTEVSEVVGIGDADGKISRYTASGGLVELYDTGEAGVHALENVGSTTYAGTGNAGKVFRSAPDWTLDTTLAGVVTCFACWQDYLFAATDQDGKLWRRTEAGWTNWHTLAGVVAINDMLAVGDELWLAVEHVTGARVYRIQAAETGHFACGPEPPDMVLKLLKTV